jgi:cytochrome c peroxidase
MTLKFLKALSFVLSALLIGTAALPLLEFEFPKYFPKTTYEFANNPLAEDKIELGRRLFYDPVLSRDSTVSCASCHSPFNAFAHVDHDLSHGIDDRIGTRNAPALFNLAWQRSFMWDGAVNHLDMQALAPISHRDEMDFSLVEVIHRLERHPQYPGMFQKAWGDTAITGERVLKSLSQFQLTLVSCNSKFDSVMRGESKFSTQESNGLVLFESHCSACHPAPLFSTYGFANNGLPTDSTLRDMGRMSITKKSEDSLLFKIPSLRNLTYTFPYMHDGRFANLRQVINHYATGIRPSATLAVQLQTPIVLNSDDKVDLFAFLLTLSDRHFVFDAKHGFPRNAY